MDILLLMLLSARTSVSGISIVRRHGRIGSGEGDHESRMDKRLRIDGLRRDELWSTERLWETRSCVGGDNGTVTVCLEPLLMLL